MGLKDDIAAIAAEAAQQLEKDKEQAKASLEAARQKDISDALAAIQHILSDDSIRTIVKAHAVKGGGGRASVAVQNGQVSLRSTGPAKEILPLTFAAKLLTANKLFENASVRERISELRKMGVAVTHRYQPNPEFLVLEINYASAVN